MWVVTSTDAVSAFADLLDAVERRGEHVTIVRRGEAIARLEPVRRGRGSDAKALLGRHRPDQRWADDLREIRRLQGVWTTAVG